MVTLYKMSDVRSAYGVRVKFIISPDQDKIPGTLGLMSNTLCTDVVFIDSLNVTVILVVTGTPVPVGVLPITVSGVLSGSSGIIGEVVLKK